MNIIAFILAILAVVCFVVEWTGGRLQGKSLLPLGLALVTSAFIVQLVWTTEHVVRIH